MVRTYDYHPPPRDPTNFFEEFRVRANQLRTLDFHKFQIFTVLDGSGNTADNVYQEQLAIDQTTGGGPLYDTWLIYSGGPVGSGINMVQVGDLLAIGDVDVTGTSIPNMPPTCYHIYVIRDILDSPNEDSGQFRVEWTRDGCQQQFGDQSPVDGCYESTEAGSNYYGGNCTGTRTVILREVNMPFFILD